MADSQVLKALLHDNPLCGIDTYKDTLNLATGACTRKIKKIAFDGTEDNWRITGTGRMGIPLSDLPQRLTTPYCTHFIGTTVESYGNMGDGECSISVVNGSVREFGCYDSTITTLADFKAYLQAQYAAGTPVTVWYVLATAETETISVPSGLTGTVEGYLNQDGTPTPTNPIYPTANIVEIWQHSLRKLTTATEAVENPLYSDGTAITAYTLKGNTVQNGTPTPSNPVDAVGVGERTAQLYNSADTIWILGILDDNGQNTGATTSHYTGNFTEVKANKSYTISGTLGADGNQYRIYFYDAEKRWVSRTPPKLIAENSFTTPVNCKYIQIQVVIAVENTTDWMLNTGSTAKPYEPYGYKIPISSGGVTTNIYLGSTQTTRKIKKLVLDGTENWSIAGLAPGQIPYFRIAYFTSAKPMKVVCTHYVSPNETISVSNQVEGVKVQTSSEAKIALMVRPPEFAVWSVDDFKSYLAQQYAAGTPVTVWYVLATAETAAINEPLMKIGDYADTLSNAASIPTTEGANSITVDTTVQPSEFVATWTGWHNAMVQEYESGVGNNKFDEQYPDISTTTAYRPIYVGDGTFTMSSTVGREGTSAVLYFLAGNVSTGAHNSTNSVYDGQNRTQTAVEGYVTIAYRYIETLSPENYDTMLSKGSTALPYEPYEYGWE